MKLNFLISAIILGNFSFAQPYTNDDYVQNFYVACKTEKFSAFNNLTVGTQLLDTRQFSRSIKKYNKALEIDSDCCDALYMLAYCYQQQGQLDQAISYCDKSIEMNPNNPSAWIIKGTTLLMKKDLENALPAFQNAKKYSPSSIDGFHGVALTYFLLNQNDEAIREIEEFEQIKSKGIMRRDIKKMERIKSYIVDNDY